MSEHGEHGPARDPAVGDASPGTGAHAGDDAGEADRPGRPAEAERAGTDAARGEESERGTEPPPG